MTTQNFSNTFDTLLASYNTQAQFGEEASKTEITLDEYEKSIFLTQAQDIILKSYFDRSLNNQGQGFDDSTRRQIDFSSLIKIAELKGITMPVKDSVKLKYVAGGDVNMGITMTVISSLSTEYTVNVQYKTPTSTGDQEASVIVNGSVITLKWCNEGESFKDGLDKLANNSNIPSGIKINFTGIPTSSWPPVDDYITVATLSITGPEKRNLFDNRGILFTLPKNDKGYTDVLFILNEKLSITKDGTSKDYVIVPISYREYDREMSKPYAQPLKKQAWRLFQNINTGFDVDSELIPIWDIADAIKNGTADAIYKIRYVKRPRPIVLTNLDGLDIDGETDASEECELNPILHMDILNKAVELAIASKVGRAARNTDREEQESRRNR